MEVVGMKKENMRFEETELRLGIGLPRNGSATEELVVRKRGFSETETQDHTMDLMLNLSTNKEPTSEVDPIDNTKILQKENTLLPADPAKPPAK